MGELEGRTIWVTGGGRGIGRAIAAGCAREGARLVLAARSKPELEAAAAAIQDESGAEVLAVPCDVSRQADVDRFFEAACSRFGPPYGLVCAAGILGAIGPFDALSPGDWERAFQVNVMGTVRCARAALGGMKAAGEGRIVLFSGAGQGPFPRLSAYAASKGAIWRLSETLGAELAPHGVFVNAIAPGLVKTGLQAEILAAGRERSGEALYEQTLKLERDGGPSPEPAVKLALFLLSPRGAGLAGKVISALWDDYEALPDSGGLAATDLFTFRRVVTRSGGTRYPKGRRAKAKQTRL